MKTVSIVIPVFNEARTARALLDAVFVSDIGDLGKEIIVVDDGSTDGTRGILKEFEGKKGCRVFYEECNRGKGAALRAGFTRASGDFVVVQDADLEYDPRELPLLLKPLMEGRADVVYGSRFLGGHGTAHRVLYFWHYVGNRFLTILSNLCTNLNLTDMETGYKAFTREAIQKIVPRLRSERFGIEPEITARAAREHLRIYEVGISYAGRTYAEGKKINWKDGAAAIWHIIKYNLLQ